MNEEEWVDEKTLFKNKITFEEDVSCPAQQLCMALAVMRWALKRQELELPWWSDG